MSHHFIFYFLTFVLAKPVSNFFFYHRSNRCCFYQTKRITICFLLAFKLKLGLRFSYMTELFIISSGKHSYAVNQTKSNKKFFILQDLLYFFTFFSATQHHELLVFLKHSMFFSWQWAHSFVDAEQTLLLFRRRYRRKSTRGGDKLVRLKSINETYQSM